MRGLAVVAMAAMLLAATPSAGAAASVATAPGTDFAGAAGPSALPSPPALGTAALGPVAAGPAVDAARERDGVQALERVVEASRQAAYQGRVMLASFTERGPAVSEIGITQGPDGELRVTRGDAWELGRVAGEAYLRSSPDTLLRLSGVERTPFDLDHLLRKYAPRLHGEREIDTGPAALVELVERRSRTRRERLYLDEETGLVVRRETFDREGEPVRVMGFTELDARDGEVARPDSAGYEVERRALTPAGTEELRDEGFVVRERLPAGFVLAEGHEVEDASVPTLHLIYSDGLYALSLYQQRGRLASSAVEGATPLTTDDGGQVWRWPGSEPRRVVWTGDRLTFTALTDAPTDELLTVASGLPTSGSPSILDRLNRGLSRVGEWLRPTNRSS